MKINERILKILKSIIANNSSNIKYQKEQSDPGIPEPCPKCYCPVTMVDDGIKQIGDSVWEHCWTIKCTDCDYKIKYSGSAYKNAWKEHDDNCRLLNNDIQ